VCGGGEGGEASGDDGVSLGSQVIGAVGAAWQLAYGTDDTAQARHLHDLGFNYRSALASNLAFSTLASLVFVWALVRVIRHRPSSGTVKTHAETAT
jgi:hypothetical protein